MDWTAYIAQDGHLLWARFARAAAGGSRMPLPDQTSRIIAGESVEGRAFEEWYQFLWSNGGAAQVRT